MFYNYNMNLIKAHCIDAISKYQYEWAYNHKYRPIIAMPIFCKGLAIGIPAIHLYIAIGEKIFISCYKITSYAAQYFHSDILYSSACIIITCTLASQKVSKHQNTCMLQFQYMAVCTPIWLTGSAGPHLSLFSTTACI